MDPQILHVLFLFKGVSMIMSRVFHDGCEAVDKKDEFFRHVHLFMSILSSGGSCLSMCAGLRDEHFNSWMLKIWGFGCLIIHVLFRCTHQGNKGDFLTFARGMCDLAYIVLMYLIFNPTAIKSGISGTY